MPVSELGPLTLPKSLGINYTTSDLGANYHCAVSLVIASVNRLLYELNMGGRDGRDKEE